MSKTQRTVTIALWGLVVVSLLALIAMMRMQSRQSRSREAQISQLKDGQVLEVVGDGQLVPATQRSDAYTFPAPSFKLTDQDGKPFDSDSLRGKVWTVSFFFSSCQGVCPGMMGRIQDLQKVTNDPNVHFVYLTVDPERDTVERLHTYASEAKADSKQWHMLTGDMGEMKRIARDFKEPYDVPAQHTAAILLVDQKGRVVNWYGSKHPDEMLKLAEDLKKLTAGEAITTPGGSVAEAIH